MVRIDGYERFDFASGQRQVRHHTVLSETQRRGTQAGIVGIDGGHKTAE
jgi:hypothetical protein